MNRRERRTKGLQMQERLRVLTNSPLLKDADLTDLPKEVIDSLVANTCENKDLQRRYNKSKKILDEIMQLQIELFNMNKDLNEKIKQKVSNASKENITHIK